MRKSAVVVVAGFIVLLATTALSGSFDTPIRRGPVASNPGTVTEVTGSDGITVVNGTTAPALSITNNGITGAKIADNAALPNGVTVTTQAANDNSTKPASTAYVDQQERIFTIPIDNIVATDNVLLFRTPRAITLLQADCYASYDNVVGSLMECSPTNVTSCTVLDAWTVTNAVNPFTESTFTDAVAAAGAWLRWSTTSVGTASLNNFLCTVRYREN